MALVDEAKRRGTWDQAASGRLDVTPPDLEAALAGVPAAAARWEDVGADPPAPVRLLGAGRQAPRDAARGASPTVVRRAAAGSGPASAA